MKSKSPGNLKSCFIGVGLAPFWQFIKPLMSVTGLEHDDWTSDVSSNDKKMKQERL